MIDAAEKSNVMLHTCFTSHPWRRNTTVHYCCHKCSILKTCSGKTIDNNFTQGNGLIWWTRHTSVIICKLPGRLTAMCAPVSVCQYVSTMEHLPPPTFSLYHLHASGLIGSPECVMRRGEGWGECLWCDVMLRIRRRTSGELALRCIVS